MNQAFLKRLVAYYTCRDERPVVQAATLALTLISGRSSICRVRWICCHQEEQFHSLGTLIGSQNHLIWALASSVDTWNRVNTLTSLAVERTEDEKSLSEIRNLRWDNVLWDGNFLQKLERCMKEDGYQLPGRNFSKVINNFKWQILNTSMCVYFDFVFSVENN